MKKVRKIFNRIANADPMIWGYVMLNDKRSKQVNMKRTEPDILR